MGPRIINIEVDTIRRDIPAEVHEAIPKRLFDLQAAADPERGLSKKISFVHRHDPPQEYIIFSRFSAISVKRNSKNC